MNIGKKAPVLSAQTEAPSTELNSEVVWKRLIDNKSEWDLTEMNRLSEGIYCPRIYKGNFVFRTLWYRQSIPTVFNQIRLRFIFTKLDQDNSDSKALIQFGDVYGKDYKVADLYLPFDKTRGVNYKSYDSLSNDLVFQDNAGSLPLAIKPESTVTMTISSINVLDNTVTYKYHIDYIPEGETDSIPKDFQYFVKLPDSSPKQLLMKFGLGVFAGSCLKEIEYVIPN